MRLRAAASDQFVAYAAWERQVGDPVTVEVPKLAAADTKLDAAEVLARS